MICNDSIQCYKELKTLATNQCESSKITDEYGQILSCKIAIGFMRGDNYMKSVENITNLSETSDNTWPKGNPPHVKGVIINTSRGGVVNEKDLNDAVNQGIILSLIHI